MHVLDHRTVERLAHLVCDPGGPYERRVRDLQDLLATAGWRDVPYDGGAKVAWLCDALIERRTDLVEFERFLCRVCDPLEYDGGEPDADLHRSELNQILQPEGLHILLYKRRRPVLEPLDDETEQPVPTAPEDLAEQLKRFLSDRQMLDLLLTRAEEAKACEEIGAHTMAVIAIGSFIEGVLFAVLVERDPALRKTGLTDARTRRRVNLDRAGLELLLDTAHQRGWIQLDARDFANNVRQYRNFVHPRNQLDRGLHPDGDTVMLCWAPVKAILNDLAASQAPPS